MENQKKSNMYIVWIIAIAVFVIFFLIGIFGSDSSNENNLNTTSILGNNISEETQQEKRNITSFNEISQIDQIRMREIITGVIQNTIPITPEIKNELRSIFKKYNATDEEINDFSIYGPAFAIAYQQYFFIDAFQAVSSGVPIKSTERLNLENEALSRGLMTTERVKLNDEEMRLIASRQPVISSDGKQVIFTADTIQSTINNLGLIVDRLVLLFKF